MAPKKSTKRTTKNEPIDSDSDENIIETSAQTQSNDSTMYLTSNSLKSTDSDRTQLAHAINNFTLKTDQFVQEMKKFDVFKENVLKMDLLIDSKKQDCNHIISNLQLEYDTKKKNLENQYTDLTKKLKSDNDELLKKIDVDHTDRVKKCETEFFDKRKILANSYEDESLQMRRKLEMDKTKVCSEYAKNLGMRFIKEDEYKELNENIQKSLKDYTELKKNFDKLCSQIKEEEKVKYQDKLNNELKTMDLTQKAINAQIVAQTEQQKKEIHVLENTIESLKSELKEQRELTKQVAQASSKSQITQTIGKN